MSTRPASSLVAALAVCALLFVPPAERAGAQSADGGEVPAVVVELFTSQGCSSCPPAEAFLGDLAARDDIIALEFHVDYWDYIGWADPFADPAYTQRQRTYGARFEQRYIYTPQMVIDGRTHEVGSQRAAVQARIEAARMKRRMANDRPDAPRIRLDHGPEGLAVALDGRPADGAAVQVFAVGFDGRHDTEVARGENAGKRLANHHVVRSLIALGTWSGGAERFTVEAADLAGDGGCAVILQAPDGGPVAAAAMVRFE